MTGEELNGRLYEKASAEQAEYRKWLLEQSPEEILHHCYEYLNREDILITLEMEDLPPKQCRALLKSRTPLADIFREYEKAETNHMLDIRDAVTSRADHVILADIRRSHRDER